MGSTASHKISLACCSKMFTNVSVFITELQSNKGKLCWKIVKELSILNNGIFSLLRSTKHFHSPKAKRIKRSYFLHAFQPSNRTTQELDSSGFVCTTPTTSTEFCSTSIALCLKHFEIYCPVWFSGTFGVPVLDCF